MLKSVEGVYEGGVIKLAEQPIQIPQGTHAIVTFLTAEAEGSLAAHGISLENARELRARLSAFAEEWDSPEMSVYDDYHAAKSRQ